MKKEFIILFAALLLTMTSQAQNTVHPGDILCTDGTTISAANYAASGKKADGVVFYVNSTGKHGWALSLTQSNSTCLWGGHGIDIPTLANNNRDAALADTAGYNNTQKILKYGLANNLTYPAAAATAIPGWYLPALGQLRQLYATLDVVNASLATISGTPLMTGIWYWSSSECTNTNAWAVGNNGTLFGYDYKDGGNYVRAVRSF